MKKPLCISILCLSACALSAFAQQKVDNTLINRAWTVGYGSISLHDEYLSPLVYRGALYRADYESMQFLSTKTNKVSLQWFMSGAVSITNNPAGNNSILYGAVSPGIGLHYHFRPAKNLKIMVGGMWDILFANKYSLSNGNNPYSVDLSTHWDVSAIAQYKLYIKKFPVMLRYSASIPVVGVMFVPEYGASYYEMFVLGNLKNAFHVASLNNNVAYNSSLTADLMFTKWIVRLAYYHDYQKNSANSLHFETMQNAFSIGLVVNLAIFDRGKRRVPSTFSDVNE